jgi:hypothetical protein
VAKHCQAPNTDNLAPLFRAYAKLGAVFAPIAVQDEDIKTWDLFCVFPGEKIEGIAI